MHIHDGDELSDLSDLHKRDMHDLDGRYSVSSYDDASPRHPCSMGVFNSEFDSDWEYSGVRCQGRYGVPANTGRIISASAAGGSTKIRPSRPK